MVNQPMHTDDLRNNEVQVMFREVDARKNGKPVIGSDQRPVRTVRGKIVYPTGFDKYVFIDGYRPQDGKPWHGPLPKGGEVWVCRFLYDSKPIVIDSGYYGVKLIRQEGQLRWPVDERILWYDVLDIAAEEKIRSLPLGELLSNPPDEIPVIFRKIFAEKPAIAAQQIFLCLAVRFGFSRVGSATTISRDDDPSLSLNELGVNELGVYDALTQALELCCTELVHKGTSRWGQLFYAATTVYPSNSNPFVLLWTKTGTVVKVQERD